MMPDFAAGGAEVLEWSGSRSQDRPVAQVALDLIPSVYELHGRKLRGGGARTPVGGAFKRGFDVVVSSALLLVLAPFLLLVWCLVRIESKGPGLFMQPRGGFRGRPFFILKFRTMTVCETDAITQAVKNDQRLTRLGWLLRRSSIDELPQLINVLKGDMSLVGPRPHAVHHDRLFRIVDGSYRHRFRARPGITGLAQVSGSRGPTETDDKIRERTRFDIQYVESWAPHKDLLILLKTVWVTLGGKNAH